MGTPNPTKMERGRCAMPVGMSAVAVLLSMALVLSMSLPSEAAGSSTAGLSQWGAGLQTRIRAGERRLLNITNGTMYTETSAAASPPSTTPAPAPAKNFEVRFTVSLPYSKADFTADKQTKFKEAVASAAGAAIADVTLTITEVRRRAGKINVEVTIKVATEAAAKTMASAITADKLNEKLKAAGLEEATMVSAPTVAKKGDPKAAAPAPALDASARPAASPIVAPVVAAVAALIASAGFMRTT